MQAYTLPATPESPDRIFFCDYFLDVLDPNKQLRNFAMMDLKSKPYLLDEVRDSSLAVILAHEMMHTSFVGPGVNP